MRIIFVTFLLFGIIGAFWIGEEYWTTVSADGSLLGDRTVEDFLTFHAIHHNIPLDNAYIAFWITYDEHGHYETFGHAYLSKNKVCARFVDRHSRAKNICGGFRVLSRSNMGGIFGFKFVPAGTADIIEAIEYRNRQIAKVISWQKNEAWYGSAYLSDGVAEGIDYENAYIKITYSGDPYFFNQYVFILVNCSRDDPDAGKSAISYYAFYHTPEEKKIMHHDRKIRYEEHEKKKMQHGYQKEVKKQLEQWERDRIERQQQLEQWKRDRIEHQQQLEQQRTQYEQPVGQWYSSDDEPDDKWNFYHKRRF